MVAITGLVEETLVCCCPDWKLSILRCETRHCEAAVYGNTDFDVFVKIDGLMTIACLQRRATNDTHSQASHVTMINIHVVL